MRTNVTRPLAAASMVLALAACGTDDDTGEAAAPTDSTDGGEAAVSIIDNDFEPADLEVAAGETVSWNNDGDVDHTVTFDDEDSGNLAPGDDYDRTFDEAGEFAYTCTIHPTMEATVTVTD